MNRIILLFVLLLTSSVYFAQSDSDKEQQLVYTLLYGNETAKAKEIIDTEFINSDIDSRKVIGYIYRADYYARVKDEAKKTEALARAKEIALKTKNPIDKAYVDYGYAIYYQKLNKDELFVQTVNESIKTFSKYPRENFMLTLLYFLKYNYNTKKMLDKYDESDFFKANQYALKSKNSLLINFTYHNLGYYYKKKFDATQNKNYIDSIRGSYQKSYEYIKLIKDPAAHKKSLVGYYLNYAVMIHTMKPVNYPKCMELYNQVIELGKDDKDKDVERFVTFAYNNIGDIYENTSKTEQAKDYYLKAYGQARKDDEIFVSDKMEIIENLSRIYEKLNDFKQSLFYAREAKNVIKKYNKEQISNQARALEIFYQTEQKNLLIKQLEEKNIMFNKQKFLYLGIILLSITGIIFLAYTLRYKQNLLVATKNKSELILQLEQEEKARLKAEQELLAIQQEQLHKQALATSLQLSQKNTFINDLKEKLKEKNDFNIDRIIKEEQSTDSDFVAVQNIVQDVHPNFFKRLNEVAKSKLTNQDLRYAAYIYLNMDNQQIANILKADPKTVRMTKYRLKQKFALGKEDDLQMYIQNLV
ncbi:tetratricopeptide repeat protein [Elizabethkingia meningoseptica]|uniref:tetratricopeptide repeat protein n=1 Tax=Elizabethkingia meningoseptica TaxID=238 RepID=UPI00093804AD|nr:tetratricopeptide repeat protein [Elizabethkingia meningoseptica]MCL1676628.1 tetratricopeptide repeat protein [Elizabethkingia meningoseptica]MCL1686767.1 tetratricopeptide repeat protein [Elizabethkingia meningoseptica]MDE5489953.1 tetratricopeptide repeat protein [Elizabethkingia meningoseptica]MVW91833.1 tetratricopeptide repeat protein [Elizabethkingia meningoseptica]